MKQNIYDDRTFFAKYSQMERSIKGLEGAGEWKTLEKMLPHLKGKRVLDLGCGFGWHCQYAIEQGAMLVIGIDISKKMLAVARQKTPKKIKYINISMEDAKFPRKSFDVIISSLSFHYLKSLGDIVNKVSNWLVTEGEFVFSVEHPVFTAHGTQDWYRDANGTILHFPVDNYFFAGKREVIFLGERVTKYHRTLTTYLGTLIQKGFEITGVVEPIPTKEMLKHDAMRDELRRPMMLIVSARKR